MSKLGPHVIRLTEDARQWARRAPVVKALDNVDALREAQPGAITIFRAYFTQDEQDAADPQLAVNRILTELNGFKPDYVELNNEWKQRLVWGLETHAEFTWQCVKRFHAIGQKVGGFSFSTGQPEMEDWLYLASWKDSSGIKRPFCGVNAVALHEYWGEQGFTTWNALRYRRVHNILGGKHPPFLITECGRDAVEGGKAGWKNCGINGEQALAEILAYAAEVDKDDYVLAVTPFTAGPTDDWNAFSTDEFSKSIPGGLPSANDMEEPMSFEFSLGFADYATERPEVGVPNEALQYDDHGNAWQHTTTGLLFWHKAANAIHFFEAAS